jgi:hypothetical protein
MAKKCTESTEEQRDQGGRFLTENSGGGRPKGSRNKLATQNIDDLTMRGKQRVGRPVSAWPRNIPLSSFRLSPR